MAVTVFNPAQLAIVSFDIDNPTVLEALYVRLKGAYSIHGLDVLFSSITAQIRIQPNTDPWYVTLKTTSRGANGELFYIVLGNSRDPLIIARASNNGQEWYPYIHRDWANHVVGYVDHSNTQPSN